MAGILRVLAGLFKSVLALAAEACGLARSLALSVALAPALLLAGRPVSALRSLLCLCLHLPQEHSRLQTATTFRQERASVATKKRAEARDADEKGIARIMGASGRRWASFADAEYKDDTDIGAFRDARSGCCIINVAPAPSLEFLPPAPDPGANHGRTGAVSLAVPGGGRAFLWSKRPRATRVKQGGVGSCWFIAPVAAVAQSEGAIEKCFPTASGGRKELPPGACPVTLYDVDGKPRTQPLDTRLYYRPGGSTHSPRRPPAYARSRSDDPPPFDSNELWVPMLEKAMARMSGRGYQGVHGGQPSRGLFALTGAPVEVVRLAENDGSILTELARGLKARDIAIASVYYSPLMTLLSTVFEPFRCVAASICGLPVYALTDLVSCLCPLTPRRACDRVCKTNCSRLRRAFNALVGVVIGTLNLAALLALVPIRLLTCGLCSSPLNGIVQRHAYTVLSNSRVFLRCCGVPCGTERVVRLRNPHGLGSAEWRGKWSDNSAYWLCVSDAERRRVKYKWSDEHYCARACQVRLCPFVLLCCPLLYYNAEAVGHTKRDDGSFFMSEADFFAVFHRVDICHHRPGWEREALTATLTGKCAYFTIFVRTDAPDLPALRMPTVPHIPRMHHIRNQHNGRLVAPIAASFATQQRAARATSPTGIAGVYASVAIVDPDGAHKRRVGVDGMGTDGVRVTVFDNATRTPVASTQPDNSRDSFTRADPVAGTNVAELLAGHTYTVFVQWGGGWALPGPNPPPMPPREVSLIVSASEMDFLEVRVSESAPDPLLPWAPVGPTAYGVCAKGECGLALPADFAYVLGERFHRECVTPEVDVCGTREL